ncbi:hypothetical protein B3C1_05020 [Gallaecimonas xiamenensis 3-C-1]|uniref:SPOR domain-containing protein n=1 Tax=Gallaecimonas xiamenensis 3-C-1 TaxID=745411 RepID=K2JNZ8_9GAMM|nr:hypothetical protein B3C1_05020 [Gallaecimonas xiamenensis 3-C-1]
MVVALLALIIPELLREPAAPTPEKFEVIPLRPEIGATPEPKTYPEDALANQVTVPQPEPLPDNDASELPPEVKGTETAQVTVKPAEKAQPKPQPKVEPKTQPKAEAKPQPVKDAWVVQMGAFGRHQSALELVKKLRNAGFKAFLVQENGLSKVLVGPETDRSRLEGQLDKLNNVSGLKGRVFHYDPLR